MTLPGRSTWCAASAPATTTTPIILMGYYNPIHAYGRERFLEDAAAAGVDGLIIVDLPPEEDEELCLAGARARPRASSAWPRRPPTTAACRSCCGNTSGFLYYVSLTGITGVRPPSPTRWRRGRAR